MVAKNEMTYRKKNTENQKKKKTPPQQVKLDARGRGGAVLTTAPQPFEVLIRRAGAGTCPTRTWEDGRRGRK